MAQSMRIWWSYLGRTYPACRDGRFLWAPYEPDQPAAQLRPDDLLVHEYRRKVVSISRVTSAPELMATPATVRAAHAGQSIWRATATYHEAEAPVHLDELRAELLRIEPRGGPAGAPEGSGRPGDLYPFNDDGLEAVLRATGTRLPDDWLVRWIDV